MLSARIARLTLGLFLMVGESANPTLYRVRFLRSGNGWVKCGADILLNGVFADLEGEATCPVCSSRTLVRIAHQNVESVEPSTAVLHYVELNPIPRGQFGIMCEWTHLFDRKECLTRWVRDHEGVAGKVSTPQEFLIRSIERRSAGTHELDMTQLDDLIFYKTGAMSFYDKSIPLKVLTEILTAATSCSWLGKWKMLCITDENRRQRVVEAWQDALRKMGRLKDVEFVERWKIAPVFIAFCQPKNFVSFGWVPAEYARIYSIQEVGTAVRSLELKGLEHGVGLHGIMGLLIPEIGQGVKSELGIPEDQELVFFGILGYPNEKAEQNFPNLEEVCYFENWTPH